jgi:hypothetical protein
MLPTGTTEIELKEVLHDVPRPYTHMRGKYYVRRLMSRSKASLLDQVAKINEQRIQDSGAVAS